MKKLLAILLLVSSVAFSQTTSHPTTILQSANDLKRPGGGVEQWHDRNTVPIPDSLAGTQKAKQKYYRFWWPDIQPFGNGSGVFSWTKFDTEINDAINNGQTFSGGIMSRYSGQGTSVGGALCFYPSFLHTAMQATGSKDFIINGNWIENYNDPTFLAAWKAMYVALNNHINSTSFNGVRYQDVVKYWDVLGYGDYGEWTNNPYSSGSWQGPAGTTPTTASLDSIISYVVHGLPNIQCEALLAMFDGNQLGNTLIPPAVGYYALTTYNNAGLLGWKRLSWGWHGGGNAYNDNNWGRYNPTTYGSFHFDTAIMARYKYAPIGGEPADLGQAPNHFQYIAQDCIDYHVAYFGNGNLDNETGNATSYVNIRNASKYSGHRIVLDSVYSTTSPVAGGQFIVKTTWKNVNNVPTYDNWNTVFTVKSGNTILQTWTGKFQAKDFYSTSTVAFIDTVNLSSVPAGSGYTLNVKIVDPTGYQYPLPLFITGVKSDGSYDIRTSLTVSGGAAVAYAGPNQTITIPTSSVTLTSGSTGSISSYAWTMVSGPNTPTIVSATSANTNVTGLIAGTYVFQLSVNAGVSTSTVNITVNPPNPPATNLFTNQVPVAGTANDYPGNTAIQGVENGVRFKSSIDGYITGIRFYKTSGNTGTHIGELYTSNGSSRLAQATFTNEGVSGWQTVAFAVPVAITAGTNYMAAYFSSLGNYVEDDNYFSSALVNRTLSANIDGSGGATSGTDAGNANGVYKYTATASFPDQLYLSANYWVDVVFVTQLTGTNVLPYGHIVIFNTAP